MQLAATSLQKTTGIPRSREFWEWKHNRNPFGNSFSIVADHQGMLIGLRVFISWKWKRGEKSFEAVRAVDTVTHPDWRGKGVFSRLTSTLLEQIQQAGIAFIFNTPNQSSLPGYLKMGWKPVTKIPLRLKILRPFHIMSTRIRKRSDLFEETARADQKILGNAEIEKSFYDWEGEERLHTARDKNYLLWR